MSRKEPPIQDQDCEVILRCQKGDIEAFGEIVLKYQKKMFNVSYRILGDYHDASEIVQDAFVSAHRNIKGFKRESRFSTWLYTIIINLSKNRLKQIRTRSYREPFSLDDPVDTEAGEVRTEPASDDLSVLEKLEKREVEQKVKDCMNILKDEFREVIVLRDVEGFSYEEISAMLKISEGTVKSRLHRAREDVKNCLRKAFNQGL